MAQLALQEPRRPLATDRRRSEDAAAPFRRMCSLEHRWMTGVKLTRASHRFERGVEWKVHLDDEIVGTIDDGSQRLFQVSLGSHQLYLTSAFARSDTLAFVVRQDELAEFECSTGITGIRILAFPVLALFKRITFRFRRCDGGEAEQIRAERGFYLAPLRPLLPTRRDLMINAAVAAAAIAGLLWMIYR
jgi:hypothetical protein